MDADKAKPPEKRAPILKCAWKKMSGKHLQTSAKIMKINNLHEFVCLSPRNPQKAAVVFG
jgi:hypothetical protein